jgi:hypothetical protein
MVGTLAGVLLLGVIQNLIKQVGTLRPEWQFVVSGSFLLVVVVQACILIPVSANDRSRRIVSPNSSLTRAIPRPHS